MKIDSERVNSKDTMTLQSGVLQLLRQVNGVAILCYFLPRNHIHGFATNYYFEEFYLQMFATFQSK